MGVDKGARLGAMARPWLPRISPTIADFGMGVNKGARFRAIAATDLAHMKNMEGISLTMAGDPAYHGRPPSDARCVCARFVCAGGRG